MATILVVDDRAINRNLLVTLLGYSGHRLLEARDGAEAMDIVRRDKPDLIITDLLMPNMNGFEFVRAIREDVALADAKVIFHTATFHPNEALLLGDACGVTTVLPKPATPLAILEAVRQALNLPLAGEPETPIALFAAAPEPQGKAALVRFGERTTASIAQAHAARCELDQLLAERAPAQSEMLKALTARLAQSEMALQRSALRLRGLVQLGLDQPIERDVNRILERFCVGVVGITVVAHVLVCLLDEKSREATCFLHTAESAETVRIDPLSSAARARVLELAAAGPQRASGVPAAALCAGLYPTRVAVKSCITVPVATA
ncbi:MAG: response regulator, partial [Betaproteobacteria bacterium]